MFVPLLEEKNENFRSYVPVFQATKSTMREQKSFE